MSAADLKVGVVLLAAGMSRRMGERNKLLIEIDGEPLVRRSAKTYLATGADVHIVLGHEAAQVRTVLHDLPVTFVNNPRFAEGQPTLVCAGLDSLESGYDAIVVALSDQAALTSHDIGALLSAFALSDRDHVLIPYYREARGNPVVFPAKIIESVGQSGRSFLDSNPQLTQRYDAPNSHFIFDIDTAKDLTVFESSRRDPVH